LLRCVGPVIDAVVGQDAQMKERVRQLALEEMAWWTHDWRVRAAAALMAQRLGENSAQFARAGGGVLLTAIKEAEDYSTRSALSDAFAAFLPRLNAAGAREVAESLMDVLGDENNAYVRFKLAQAFAALAPRLDADDARRLALLTLHLLPTA